MVLFFEKIGAEKPHFFGISPRMTEDSVPLRMAENIFADNPII